MAPIVAREGLDANQGVHRGRGGQIQAPPRRADADRVLPSAHLLEGGTSCREFLAGACAALVALAGAAGATAAAPEKDTFAFPYEYVDSDTCGVVLDPDTGFYVDGPLVTRHGVRDDFDAAAFCAAFGSSTP